MAISLGSMASGALTTTTPKVFSFSKADFVFRVPVSASRSEPSRFDRAYLASWFRHMDEGNFRYDFREAVNSALKPGAKKGGKFKYILQLCPQRVANRRPPQVSMSQYFRTALPSELPDRKFHYPTKKKKCTLIFSGHDGHPPAV